MNKKMMKPKKKAAGGMIKDMMPPRGRPPEGPDRPPRPIPRPPKTMVRTKAIDPKLPRGKAGKGPLEPTDSTTRVPVVSKSKLRRRKPSGTVRPSLGAGLGGGQPPQPKGPAKLPGAKDGGMMKKAKGYKAGGSVKTKACGAAKKGYGKAYMKGKR